MGRYNNQQRSIFMITYARWIKVLLHLLILVDIGILLFIFYKLFVSNTINGSNSVFLIIILVVLLVWFIYESKKVIYKYLFPSFKISALILVSFVLLLSFAKISPFSEYKDTIFNKISSMKCSPTKEVLPDIPFGTYAMDKMLMFEENITIKLNRDYTYEINSEGKLAGETFGKEKIVGYYETTKDYITFINDLDQRRVTCSYRYSEKFECLYLYISEHSEPQAYYKQGIIDNILN
jgi:hypothetical protein